MEEGTKVYLLEYGCPFAGLEVIGIFDSREKAESHGKKLIDGTSEEQQLICIITDWEIE